MKLLIVGLVTLTSFSTFASGYRVASSHEKIKLCEAVEKALQEDNIDAGVNMDYCPKAFIRVKGDVISGNVPLYAPARAYDVKCSAIMKYGIVSLKSLTCKYY